MKGYTYTVRADHTGTQPKYFASFTDGEGIVRETEISNAVYLALEDSRKHEKRQRNFDDRHVERFVLTEGQLHARACRPIASAEEEAIWAADWQTALATLTTTQRRRFLLHYECGLSMEQIARIESCNHSTVTRSVSTARERLKIFFD